MTTKQRVMQKLASNAALRDSDRLLMLSVWRDEGLELTPQQERKFMEVTSPETLRRERQKIQSDGLYPASKKVFEQRKELEVEHKKGAISDRFTSKAVSWLYDEE